MVEGAESRAVGLVRNPRFRNNGEDEEEQGGTARAAVARRRPCWWCWWMPTSGDTDVVETLPKAVTGAINVSNSSCVVKGYFVMIEISYWLPYRKQYKILFNFLGSVQQQRFFLF